MNGEGVKHLHNKTGWVHTTCPDDNELKRFSLEYDIPLQVLKDALDEEEKPKVYPVNNSMLVVYKVPSEQKGFSETTSMALFLTNKGMLSIAKQEVLSIKKLFNNKELVKNYLSKGPVYLLYRALEAIGDDYFKIIDSIDDELDKVEKNMFSNANKNSVKQLYKLKKTLIYFHKGLSNNREVLSNLANGQNLSNTETKYFQILKEEVMQMLDMITLYREITASSMEIYMTSISNNLNQVMKRLTAGASLVMVPTFITGLYGMNFQYLPEIYWKYGYLFAWFLIIASFSILWIYFKKKDYL